MFKHPKITSFLRDTLQTIPNLHSKMPHANNLDLWFFCLFCFPEAEVIHATHILGGNVTLIIRVDTGQILAIITSAMCGMLPWELFAAPEAS